ncbi:hypothetical protein [Nesterenkonia flava]|uniref:EcsC family protein n=1 Tax=Nesterenkonia flava TaxID=469799 RepID=A0ABU1FTI2_9MICC|nr:hypothetical protein [Nesterenkonia flava]MDR5711970.1 hypothetical protein [Nesterenkonia flava]
MASKSIQPYGASDRTSQDLAVPSPGPMTGPGGGKAPKKGKKASGGQSSLMRSAATSYVATKGISLVSKQAFNEDGTLTPSAETFLTRAVTVQRPIVLANLRRLRKAHPTLTNRQLAHQLDKEFKRSMTGGGALIGATAAVPAVGTIASLGISTLATSSFLELSALYAQSVAELSGVTTENPDRAKLLVMGIMLGEEGRKLLAELSDQAGGRGTGPYGSLVPMNSLASGAAASSSMAGLIVDQLKRQFIKRFFIRQGTSMVGRALPYGIGAVVGGTANRALAKQIIASAHKTFGELPEETPPSLVEDFKRGLEREKQRADRKERRLKKKELKAQGAEERKERKRLRKAEAEQNKALKPSGSDS